MAQIKHTQPAIRNLPTENISGKRQFSPFPETYFSLLFITCKRKPTCLLVFQFLFLHHCVYHSHGRKVHNVAHGAVCVGEMHRLVQTHLHRAYYLHVGIHHLYHLVSRASGVQALEHQRVYFLALNLGKGELLVAQLAV